VTFLDAYCWFQSHNWDVALAMNCSGAESLAKVDANMN
jgi:hypothetical protein